MTIKAIADISKVDSRTANRVLEFLIQSQDHFAKTEVKILEGKWGKVIWKRDRIDKAKLPERVREWYIEARFFSEKSQQDLTLERVQDMFIDTKRTPVEEVVRRIYITLEIEDDITVAELARRTKTNRRTIDRALNLIIENQDQIATGIITKKDLVIWRPRPSMHDLDETSMMRLLKMWYFSDVNNSTPNDKERELLLSAS
ncbi:MAG: hypothetical protein DRO87_02055 [Candidatus Thorarchaeota archaeon]|nr:MAG: hypothetical protein DRO87_02055 [Candidatus Thorarchaeota archaeon]